MPFIMSVKGTHDHFNLMLSKRQAKLRVEETATGGGDVETSELDVLMDEIKNDSDICQTQLAENKGNDENEKAKGEEIRFAAMESLTETKKRKSGNEEIQSPLEKDEEVRWTRFRF